MPRKRSVAEIVEDARQIEELVAAGLPLADAVKAIGVTKRTYLRWRTQLVALDDGEQRAEGASDMSGDQIAPKLVDRPVALDPPVPDAAIAPTALETPASPEPRLARTFEPGPHLARSAPTASTGQSIVEEAEDRRTEALDGSGPPPDLAAPDRQPSGWRTVPLLLAAAAAPTLAMTAALWMLWHSDRFAAPAVSVTKLEQQDAATIAAIDTLRKDAQTNRNEIARLTSARTDMPSLVELRDQDLALAAKINSLAEATRAGDARTSALASQLEEARNAVAKIPAGFDRWTSDIEARVGKLSEDGAAGRSQLDALGQQVRDMTKASGLVGSDLAGQRRDLLARIERIDRDGAADRAELKRIGGEVDSVFKTQLPAAADVDRRKTEALGRIEQLVGTQIDRLRQETAANRDQLTILEKRLADLSMMPSRIETTPSRDTPPAVAPTAPKAQAPAPVPAPDVVAAPAVADAPDTNETASVQPAPLPPDQARPSARVLAALPVDASPRIVLRIAQASEAAKTRAAALERSLRARGLDVVKSSEQPLSLPTNKVVYYYKEDRASAERIANGVAAPGPVQQQFSEDGSLPRPGTIEVAIVQ